MEVKRAPEPAVRSSYTQGTAPLKLVGVLGPQWVFVRCLPFPSTMQAPAARRGKTTTSSSAKGKPLALTDGFTPSEEDNPFKMPSNADVFAVRENERRREAEVSVGTLATLNCEPQHMCPCCCARLQDKLAVSRLKVWDKTTASSRVGRAPRVADVDVSSSMPTSIVLHKSVGSALGASADSLSKERRREPKENMANFIAKKREMFMVQMALDTKREEIQKLEQKAQAREDALKKSELLLEEVSAAARALLGPGAHAAYPLCRRTQFGLMHSSKRTTS